MTGKLYTSFKHLCFFPLCSCVYQVYTNHCPFKRGWFLWRPCIYIALHIQDCVQTLKKPVLKTMPNIFLLWCCDPTRVMAFSLMRFLDHTQQRTTVGRTPLDEWSARRGDLYPTTHDTHNRQTSIPPVGFEPTISTGERPQTYALDRAATGSGTMPNMSY